jgi:putative NADPH-quinone reductase
MNILIITAHPSSKGDTHTIAKTYADAKRAKGDTVELVDLYSPQYKVDLFAFENIREFPISPIQKKFHEQMTWAHEVVFVHPVWWSSVPAVMKNWIDLTIWPRVAYKYTPTGAVEKLWLGKSAKVFVTCGGPAWHYYVPFVLPLRNFWQIAVLWFCGIDLVDFKVCGNLDVYKDEKRTKHLEKFMKKIKESAE